MLPEYLTYRVECSGSLRSYLASPSYKRGIVTFDLETCSHIASCTPLTLARSPAGTATITPEDVDGGSTANCSNPILSLSQTEFDSTHLGENLYIRG